MKNRIVAVSGKFSIYLIEKIADLKLGRRGDLYERDDTAQRGAVVFQRGILADKRLHKMIKEIEDEV